MNCQEFETLALDLARERLMDAAARGRGLSHAEDCTRCAARLADERALNAGLLALAADGAETAHAPAHLEEALLAAFRARGKKDATPVVAILQPRIVPASASRSWMTRAVGAAVAAAAAVLVTFGLVAPRWQTNDAPPSPQQQASKQADGSQTASPDAPAAVAILVEPPAANENVSTQTSGALVATGSAPRSSTRRNVAERRDGGAMRPARGGASDDEMAANRRAPVAVSNDGESNAALSNAAASDGGVEIATEFMPLVPGGTSASSDGGQLVRVELPRSALVSMGLPLNVDGSSERVKADVLLGEDGLARAIRFVR